MSTIRAVDRTFSILRIIANNPEGIGVNRIARDTDLPNSTVSRLLTALEDWEAVTRTPDNRFQIGSELVRLAGQQPFTQNLTALARPVLQEIAETTGESIALCILDKLQIYYLDHVDSTQAIRVRDWTGEHLPLHVAAPGKIFLAYGSAALRDQVLDQPLAQYASRTITSPEQLRAEFPKIRNQGYAISDEEFEDGVFGFAVPIRDANSEVIAAFNLYGPKFRLEDSAWQRRIIEAMLAGATDLERKLN